MKGKGSKVMKGGRIVKNPDGTESFEPSEALNERMRYCAEYYGWDTSRNMPDGKPPARARHAARRSS